MAQRADDAPWVPAVRTFGDRLVLVRRHLGLSQADAASRCNLDDGSWSNWERGSTPRNLAEVVESISRNLGVHRDWLMWGGDPSRANLLAEGRLLSSRAA